MKLTENQKENIHQHLTRDNNLEDKEVISELFDHYILAIESKEDNNSFENALNEVFWSFGGKKGLQKLEDNRYKERQNIIDKMLKNTVKSYFTSRKIVFVPFVVVLSLLMKDSPLMIGISCVLVTVANIFIVAKTSHRTLFYTFLSDKTKVLPINVSDWFLAPIVLLGLIALKDSFLFESSYFLYFYIPLTCFAMIGKQMIFCEVMLKYYKKNELYLK